MKWRTLAIEGAEGMEEVFYIEADLPLNLISEVSQVKKGFVTISYAEDKISETKQFKSLAAAKACAERWMKKHLKAVIRDIEKFMES